MENLLHIEFIIILLLFIVSIVAIAMRLIKLPYTVALVLVGLTLAFLGRLEINLTREIILLIFIPPLVFEAAFHIHFDDLRENLALITILAVPGVLVVTFITGGIMAWAGGLSIGTALVFGALIAATDPVAVVAIFKELGAPKKLATIVEGESLFNDGTAIVIFNIILGIAISGDFNALNGVFDFTLVSGGGIVIGLGLGWVCARIITAIDDRLVETTLTTVLAYGAYLAAEEAHVSGVLAVVAAGILNGNISPQKMSATSKVVVFSFWEYVAFLANSLIFLLIGLEIDLNLLRGKWGLILLAWGSLMLARAIAVYGLGWLENRLRKNKIPRRWQHLLTWGGLKGAISLALALGLPASLGPDRDIIVALTFGVVLLTLLVQATTLKPLISQLGIVARTPVELAYQKTLGELISVKAAKQKLLELHQSGAIPQHTWETLNPEVSHQESQAAAALQTLIETEPSVQNDVIATTRRDLLVARRGALHSLNRDGLISEEIFEELVVQVDSDLDRLEFH